MLKQGFRKHFILFVLVTLLGCTTTISPLEQGTENDSIREDAVATPNALSQTTNPSVLPTATFTPTGETVLLPSTPIPTEEANTPTTTPSEQVDSSSKLIFHETCPTILESNSKPLLSRGSILYATGKVDEGSLYFFSKAEHSDVLAFVASNPNPVTLYEIPPDQDVRVLLSIDGTKLLRFEQKQPSELEYFAVVYDLETKGEFIASDSQPHSIAEWLPDNRIKYLVNREHQFGEGESYEYLIVDPFTQETESMSLNVSLPNYHYYEEPSYEGIASMSRNGQLILYTVKGPNVTSDVALRDIEKGMNIWYQEGSHGVGYSYPTPKWAVDDSSVLFSMWVSDGEEDYNKIFSITRDGREEELPPQPYPLLDQSDIRDLSFSPDGRYIHYSIQETLATGTGYIVDVSNSWVGAICDEMGTFIDGQWVTEDQFVYKILLESGGQALRLLDIPTWTTQTLDETPPGQGFIIFGWTYLEF